MDLATALIIAALIVGASLVVFAHLRRDSKPEQASQNIVLELVQGLRKEMLDAHDRIHDQLHKNMSSSQTAIQQQFEQTVKIVQDVTTRLTSLDQTNKQVLDFSGQLKSLQSILQNPKQRGVLGEYWLERLLANVLPPESYKMQFQIGVDETGGGPLIADAAIFIRDQIIPIDAKFSLENYNRLMQEEAKEGREKLESALKADVKKRIDETSKYIRPQDGTMDFAFMFIPAEGVYYNLLNAEVGSSINSVNLIEYAFQKHVMIVSPTSFFAYLQTVLLGLRELQLEKSTQEIIKRVKLLGNHLNQYADLHTRLGKNLGTVVSQYNLSSGELAKIDGDVYKITSGEAGGELSIDGVEKPKGVES